jgi:hypothetical protein
MFGNSTSFNANLRSSINVTALCNAKFALKTIYWYFFFIVATFNFLVALYGVKLFHECSVYSVLLWVKESNS